MSSKSTTAATTADEKAVLREYYKTHFPFELLARWLSVAQPLSHREIGYSFGAGSVDRYNGYVTSQMWAADVRRRVPQKIDIGAVYPCSIEPHRTRLGNSFQAWRRELTFDVDANDYDNARWCCRGQTRVCAQCWPLIAAAVRIIDAQLREEYGYRNICWFYSGRRGVHGWVRDTEARRLTQAARRAAVADFSLDEERYKRAPTAAPADVVIDISGENARDPSTPREAASPPPPPPLTRVRLGTHVRLQPRLARAVELAEPEFERLMRNQCVFTTPERWSELLAMLPCAETRRELDTGWHQSTAPANALERWFQLQALVTNRLSSPAFADAPHVLHEIVLAYMYPRIDAGVLRSLNHMLKSPLCVHPSTGAISVPLDVARIGEFNPELALSAHELVTGNALAAQAFAAMLSQLEQSIALIDG